MTLPITQKFASPVQEEGKFSAQLERYSQQLSLAINAKVSYDYTSAERPTGSVYLFLDKELPVYSQTIHTELTSNFLVVNMSIQSPNQGIVFLSYSGFITVSGISYPLPYYDGTSSLLFSVNSSGNISINATNDFVGGEITLIIFYVYIF